MEYEKEKHFNHFWHRHRGIKPTGRVKGVTKIITRILLNN